MTELQSGCQTTEPHKQMGFSFSLIFRPFPEVQGSHVRSVIHCGKKHSLYLKACLHFDTTRKGFCLWGKLVSDVPSPAGSVIHTEFE